MLLGPTGLKANRSDDGRSGKIHLVKSIDNYLIEPRGPKRKAKERKKTPERRNKGRFIIVNAIKDINDVTYGGIVGLVVLVEAEFGRFQNHVAFCPVLFALFAGFVVFCPLDRPFEDYR